MPVTQKSNLKASGKGFSDLKEKSGGGDRNSFRLFSVFNNSSQGVWEVRWKFFLMPLSVFFHLFL